MKKTFLLICISMFFTCIVYSNGDYLQNLEDDNETVIDSTKPKNWKVGLTTSVNFSQMSFTNWAAGGTGNIALNGYINAFANFHKDKHNWDNILQLGYGVLKEKEREVRKTDDKIIFYSKYGYAFTKRFRATAAAGFRSQFTKGYDYKNIDNPVYVSNFMAPGYVTFGVGLDYLPWDWLTINYSPLLSKFTFVTEPELRVQYGNDDSTQLCKTRLGSQLTVGMNKEILKNVTLTSMSSFFTDYLADEFTVVVNWDFMLLFKINSFLSANLTTNLIWDKNILTSDTDGDEIKDTAKVQFKEVFGIGLTFSF
ncbi:MAG: DUF3078 domain-containing protein [Bacteroidales bacterium]|jgi:hypothetical protein